MPSNLSIKNSSMHKNYLLKRSLFSGKAKMQTLFALSLLAMCFFISSTELKAQCDATVPTYTVNYVGNPSGSFQTPAVTRNGNCCGTTSPDRCIHFSIDIDANVAAV